MTSDVRKISILHELIHQLLRELCLQDARRVFAIVRRIYAQRGPTVRSDGVVEHARGAASAQRTQLAVAKQQALVKLPLLCRLVECYGALQSERDARHARRKQQRSEFQHCKGKSARESI